MKVNLYVKNSIILGYAMENPKYDPNNNDEELVSIMVDDVKVCTGCNLEVAVAHAEEVLEKTLYIPKLKGDD